MRICRAAVFLLLIVFSGAASATTYISSPNPGDQIQGDTATFSLVNRYGNATTMWMYVGNQPGATDFHNSGPIDGAVDTWTVTGLPMDSRRLYVRFYIKRPLHGWEYTDHEYYADDRANDRAPYLTAPVNRSILTGTSVEFDWTPVLYGATRYWLYIGNLQGGSDVYDSGPLSGSPFTVTVNGLPSDGRALFARFWWYTEEFGWEFQDYRYLANSGQVTPFITYPIDQTTASDGVSLYTYFHFDAADYDVESYWIYLGSRLGLNDLHDSGRINGQTITGDKESERVIFPKNGRAVYARFFYQTAGGNWEHTDYLFKSGGSEGKPYMSVPRPGGVGLFTRTRFIWDAELSEPSDYWLYVGTQPHTFDLYNSGLLPGDARDVTLDLPSNTTIYTTLYYRRDGGRWFHHDAEYTVR